MFYAFYIIYVIYVNNLMCCYLSYNYLCDFYYLSEVVEIIVNLEKENNGYLELLDLRRVNEELKEN